MPSTCRLAGLATLLLLALSGSARADSLAIELTPRELRVTGATPGASVIVTGYEERLHASQQSRIRRQRIDLADAQGVVIRQFASDIAPRSFWIAVDVATGAVAAATPVGGLPLSQRPIPDDLLKKDNNGQLKKLVSRLPYASFLLVRPGEGAWELIAGDGGVTDGDHSVDGKIETDLDQMEPMVAVSAPPKKFEEGDVLLILLPNSMSFFLHRVGANE